MSKLKDILTKLGINLEQEVDNTNLDASELKEEENKNLVVNNVGVDNALTEEINEEKEEEKEMGLKIPKYDSTTGLFDVDSTDNEELKALLKSVNDCVSNKANQSLIDKAVSDKLNKVKLHRGISAEFVKKNLDLSGVAVQNGKVVGVDEAFTSLQKEQAGLFVAEKKESSPLLEGYNPIKSNSYDISGLSITDAMNMQEQGL